MKPLRIGVYRRVSTDDQVRVFEGSLDSQKYRIDEFVRFKNVQAGANWGEIIDYYDEEGVSAGTTNRPEYQRLMADIRKGRINMILVSDLTRLSRNLLDFCNLISELEQYKASYLSMKEQFDTSTPIGRMIVYIIIALGQFERETTSERVAINGHTRALKGLMNGGAAPLGYNRDAEKPGLLVINENEADVVQLIFKTFLEEGSRSRTVEKLNLLKIQPKGQLKQSKRRGPAEWTIKSLGNVLSNYGYIGMREVNKMYKEDEQNHLKPWQQYKIVKASWPSIIEDQAFYDAQKLIQEASEKERMRINTGEYRSFLLTGLLTCGETGLPLMGQTGTGKMGTSYRYYHYRKAPKGTSVRPRLNADDVEKKVLHELGTLLAREGYFTELEELIEKNFKASHQTQIQQHKSIRNRLAEIEQSISMIWANQSKMNLSEEALRFTSDELNRLAEEKKNLTKELQALGSVPEEIDAKAQALFAENQVRACMNGWTKATPNIRKRLLRRTIKEIIVTPNELQIALWTSRSEQERDLGMPFVDDTGNIVALPRLNRSGQLSDIKKPLRNAQIESSGEVYNGSEHHRSPEFYQLHRKIELLAAQKQAIYSEFADLYKNGLSLSDITKQTSKSKSVIRASLLKDGIELRGNVAPPAVILKSLSGKSNTQPPYGFCYFQGKVVPDQKEYENLMLIYQLWKLETNPNRIADTLTEKKIQPRLAKSWNRNSVINILNRFKYKQIILKGGHLELR